MPAEVCMPKLTHDMDAGVLLEWYKQEGDEVQKGEPLFSVETDKAAVDVEAEESGVLRDIRFDPGDVVPIGEIVGRIVAPGEEPSPWAGGRIVATPVAKRIAQTNAVDLRQLSGRGPHGRITKADVEAHLAHRRTPPAPTGPSRTAPDADQAPYEIVTLSRLRQRTGERMLASVRTAPHFDLEVEVDASEAGRWRARYGEEDGTNVSYTALLVRVVAYALREHPQLNASFVDGEAGRVPSEWPFAGGRVPSEWPFAGGRVPSEWPFAGGREINVGVAMATANGLMVPVIHHADEMSLRQIQTHIARLREKAKPKSGGRFAPEDIQGGTFTVSNLGMYGVDAFRAIINPPEAAILAVGRIVERPVGVGGQIVLRPLMRLVLSVDHRAVDGAQAAAFLASIRRYLENPYLML